MSSIDVNSVLSQIRALNRQAAASPATIPLRAEEMTPAAAQNASGFGALVKQSLDQVNKTQADAGALQQKFELGDPNTDLATVMVASAKANVSFRALVEVRNRAVNAYQEIMNMPL